MLYRQIAAASALALATGLGACANAGMTQSEKYAVETAPAPSQAQKTDIAALNELIPVYIDAAALYKQAADIPDNNPQLKPILLDLAKQRQADREMLQDTVVAMGGKPAEFGEAIGTGHRAFTELRTIVDKDSEVAVEEVLRGEHYIDDRISAVLEGDVSGSTESMLIRMRDDARARITALEKIDDAV
jgi:uncharacterized protein (TIGR02284 family)